MRYWLILALVLIAFTGMPVHAQESKAQIVLVNNAALKTAQSMTIQIYKMNGKKPTLLKNQLVVSSDPCSNGCDNPSMSIEGAPGDYKIVVFGGVVLENNTVTFPMKAGDEFVWMISNRENTPHIRVSAPGVTIAQDKGPFRIDLVTYTKGIGKDTDTGNGNEAPATTSHKKAPSKFWPFKPSKKSHITN